MASDVLGPRALNRALLQRQALLEREDAAPLELVERLVGLQAQVPTTPYVALWSRLRAFDPAQLSTLVAERRAVRAGLLRATIHLVSARDCLAIQPVTLPVLQASFRSAWAKHLAGADPAEVAAAAAALLDGGEALTRAQLGERLAPRWPAEDPAVLGHAATHHLPLVQVPPRGEWGRNGQPRWARTDRVLADVAPARTTPEELVLRYLRAFGPATAADVRTWSRLTGVRDVLDRVRPDLRVLRDERGRELLDVPDGPLPDPRTPAPPRFLPEYDNILLSHEERSRILPGGRSPIRFLRGRWIGTLLVDGFYRTTWSMTERDGAATLELAGPVVAPGDPPGTREAVEAEGLGLLALIAPGAAERSVRFAGPAPAPAGTPA